MEKLNLYEFAEYLDKLMRQDEDELIKTYNEHFTITFRDKFVNIPFDAVSYNGLRDTLTDVINDQ